MARGRLGLFVSTIGIAGLLGFMLAFAMSGSEGAVWAAITAVALLGLLLLWFRENVLLKRSDGRRKLDL